LRFFRKIFSLLFLPTPGTEPQRESAITQQGLCSRALIRTNTRTKHQNQMPSLKAPCSAAASAIFSSAGVVFKNVCAFDIKDPSLAGSVHLGDTSRAWKTKHTNYMAWCESFSISLSSLEGKAQCRYRFIFIPRAQKFSYILRAHMCLLWAWQKLLAQLCYEY